MEVSPLSVLVIDPDHRSRNFLSTFLAREGNPVQVASLAKEGYIAALRDKPDIIIFDPSTPDMPGLELVHKLRTDKRTALTILVALAPALNQTEMVDLLGAGCNEYLVKSNEAIERIRQIFLDPSSVGKATPLSAPGKPGGMLVVFMSAKGGIGTTSLCTNIAQIVASREKGLDVALLDLVLPIGSISSLVGARLPFGLVDAAAEKPEIITADYLRRNMPPLDNWGIRLMAGSPDPESASHLDISRVPSLVAALRQAFDVVFVDLGRSMSKFSLPLILSADVAVMVLATDVSTSVLTQTVMEYLRSKGLDARQTYLILNRAVGLEGLSKAEAERIIGSPIQATVPYMAANFTLSNNQHLPLLYKFPNDSTALMLNQISQQIMEIARRARS